MTESVHEPLHERLYQQALVLGDGTGERRVPFQSIAEAHGDATQGSLLLVLAAPCLIPVPGAGSLFSIGLMLLALAMWRGQLHSAGGQGASGGFRWPRRLAQWEMPVATAQKLLNGMAWLHAHSHRWCRPRWDVFRTPAHRYWMALWVAAMALLILLPIPFGNLLPAISLMLLGAGLIHRDGLVAGIGLALGSLTLVGFGLVGVWLSDVGWQLLA